MKIPYPRQVILVSSRYKNKDNVMTLSWHSPASFEPELYTIYVGKQRYSYEMIRKSKRFCINFISEDDKELAITAGRQSGKDTDKFEKIEKEECEKIDCPRIKKALAYMECELTDEIETGDHAVFVGKVVKKDAVKEGKRLFQVEGNNFTTTI